MRLVILESPYAGDVDRNLRYLRACLADCLRRGEAPFASHGLYAQPGVLRDEHPEERARGMAAGFAWRRVAEATVAYLDLGESYGMQLGMAHARELGQPIELRRLGGAWALEARAVPPGVASPPGGRVQVARVGQWSVDRQLPND